MIARQDLPLGTLAAMITHAAADSASGPGDWDPDLYGPNLVPERQCACAHSPSTGNLYRDGCGTCMGRGLVPLPVRAVVLGVPDESALRRVDDALAARGIPHRTFHEPDPPWHGQAMAIGVVPTRDRGLIRPVLGNLPLLKGTR